MDTKSPAIALSREEIARYGRHLTLPEVGVEGQKRLKAASVLIIGAGGLGAPVSLYLAAGGIGRIGLVDFDAVEASNLQRQVLFGVDDLGRSKVEAAKERLTGLNPDLLVETWDTRFTPENAMDLVAGYDLVVDGTDNFPTRYLVNDTCVLQGKPNVYGSIYRFEGQASLFAAEDGPCYRCLFPEPPAPGSVPNCAEGGVLGILPGIVGSIQATEAIKWILGKGESLQGRLLLFHALEMRFQEIRLRKDPACPACGENRAITSLQSALAVEAYQEVCASEANPAPSEEESTANRLMEVSTLKKRIDRGDDLCLLDVRTPMEWEICRIEGSRLVPLQELAFSTDALPNKNREIVVLCHKGIRSAAAMEWLISQGYPKVWNLAGGIDSWAAEIEPGMPRY